MKKIYRAPSVSKVNMFDSIKKLSLQNKNINKNFYFIKLKKTFLFSLYYFCSLLQKLLN